MKKIVCIFTILIMLFSLTYCGRNSTETDSSNTSDQRALEDIISAFEDQGIDVKTDKPLFELVGATDGVIFYIDDSPVKIYEFKDEKDYEKQKEQYSILEGMPANGKFVLDTSNEEAIKIFNSISISFKGTSQNKEKAAKEKIQKINVGDVIKDDRAEITIKKIEFSYDVLPDNTSGFYSHYPAESGKVYIHIDTDVKNIQKQDLACDDIMTVKVDYNDGYKYDGFPIPEDSTTGFTYANIVSITSLTTQGVRFLVECPQEVEQSQNPVKITFTLSDNEYEYKMR